MFGIMGIYYDRILGIKAEGYISDYAKMYYRLFYAMTESTDILQKAQQEAEEIYLSAEDPVVYLRDTKIDCENNGKN